MGDPRVLVVTMAHDEAFLLPYFLRHYLTFAAEVWVFDNESTDATADVARSFGPRVRVHACPTGGVFDEDKLREVKAHSWKPRRGAFDGVVVADVDELLHHPEMLATLAEARALGATLLAPLGCEMVAEAPPAGDGQIYAEVRRGARSAWASKPCCFDPQRVVDLNLSDGAHWARADGHVLCYPAPGLKLLHFHNLGVDYVLARYAARCARVVPAAVERGWLTYDSDRTWVAARHARLHRAAETVV
jgi:glycosyltransferase involved in cell wall biosynthesis